jgi:hypothetical protein
MGVDFNKLTANELGTIWANLSLVRSNMQPGWDVDTLWPLFLEHLSFPDDEPYPFPSSPELPGYKFLLYVLNDAYQRY